MTAKIKDRNPYDSRGYKHKPRRVNDKDFEKVYWPFLPVVLAASVLLGMAAHSGTLATYIKHPTSKVLSYAVSTNTTKLLAATNDQRVNENEPSLALNNQLSAAAQAKADDMASRNYWSHNTPEGTPPWAFVTSTGYKYDKLGENLATGFDNELSVVKAWMASEPHRANILDPSFNQVGFGFANSENYTVAGGGPMTIVVAFYAQSQGSSVTFAKQSSSNTISTDNPDAKSLPSATSRSEIAFSSSSASSWGPAAIAFCLVGLVALFSTKHFKSLRIALKKSERYVWRHPLVDLGIIVLIVLLVIISQTAGYIQ